MHSVQIGGNCAPDSVAGVVPQCSIGYHEKQEGQGFPQPSHLPIGRTYQVLPDEPYQPRQSDQPKA